MKTAVITLNGMASVGDKPKTIKMVNFTDEKTLKAHLKELQRQYLVNGIPGTDKVKISRHEIPSKVHVGKNRVVLDASSYSDWHHVAHIGLTLKEGSAIPVETI